MLKVMFPESDHIMITENELTGLFNLAYRVSNSIKWYNDYKDSEEGYRRMKIILFISLLTFSLVCFITGVVFLL